MAAPAFSIQRQNGTRLADPALREGLLSYARRRLPPAEVEDVVQNTLTEALAAENAPSDPADFQRWLHGIARHKIADSYRRRGRLPLLSPDVDQSPAEPGTSTGELRQWIESELPKTDGAQRTLHWLLREGDGESLDEIARDADLPAPRVRQRVSRLRRHFHARWLALGAAGLLLLLGVGALFYRALAPAVVPPSVAREPLTPLERAGSSRQNPQPPKAIPDLPAAPKASATDTKATPKQHAPPSKLAPKQLAPSNKPAPKQLAPSNKPAPKQLAPKQLPASKAAPQNAAPSQQAMPVYDPGNESSKQLPTTKKR
jgi:RNA polymerase sigma factor (sigma-70 family)